MRALNLVVDLATEVEATVGPRLWLTGSTQCPRDVTGVCGPGNDADPHGLLRRSRGGSCAPTPSARRLSTRDPEKYGNLTVSTCYVARAKGNDLVLYSGPRRCGKPHAREPAFLSRPGIQ